MSSTLHEFDIDAIAEKLRADFRLQDWDMVVDLCTMTAMLDNGQDRHTRANVTIDTCQNQALIRLNKDHEDMQFVYDDFAKTGWLYALIHELIHIMLYKMSSLAENMINMVTDDEQNCYFRDDLECKEESTVNSLTRAFINVMGYDWVLQYKRGNNNEAKVSRGCKGKED